MEASKTRVIRLNFPVLPAAQEWLFTIKCFASAMLATYISFKIGLTHPFWAVGTCYVIAAPLAGSVRSKGMYRSLGTILAGLMVIITIPLFANYRSIYVCVLGGFAAVCMYISLLDRTPRAYIFMLAGYTAAIIGTPLLAETHNMMAETPFQTAADRAQEIIIALLCSSVVHGLVFPQSIGNALLARLDQAINDAKQWAADVLAGIKGNRNAPPHRKLAQDITELRMMATHLPFDNHNIRWTADVVRVLHDRLASLVPIVSGMEDRMTALKEGRSEVRSTAWRELLGEIATWCQRGIHAPGRARQLRNRIKELTPETDINAGWSDMLQINFASELNMLVDAFEDCFRYRYQIEIGVKKGTLQEVSDLPPVSNRALHTDKGQAVIAAAGVFFSTAISAIFWIVTDWPTGFQAPTFACIMSSIFAAQDDPTPGLKASFWYTFYSVPFSAFYLLVGVPSAHTMEMLILVLAPFFLVAGIYVGRPATAGRFLMTIMSVVGMLMLYDFGQQDLETYINGQSAQLVGIAIAIGVNRLLRNASVERMVRRIMRAGWQEIARVAAAKRPVSIAAIAVRMTDRVNLLAPRLAMVESKIEGPSLDLMEDVRVSINMAHLLGIQDFLRENKISLDAFMKDLSAYFTAKLKQAEGDGRDLLVQLDRLLYQACSLPASPRKNETISALAGIRRDIFPNALFYRAVISGRGYE
ncbi:FUSC family protein [Oxalobacter sp. OttesenSCG-928-P03]|nr:FUSC family protein [Oxalobacter sp. OttesenSCG-928-P03]